RRSDVFLTPVGPAMRIFPPRGALSLSSALMILRGFMIMGLPQLSKFFGCVTANRAHVVGSDSCRAVTHVDCLPCRRHADGSCKYRPRMPIVMKGMRARVSMTTLPHFPVKGASASRVSLLGPDDCLASAKPPRHNDGCRRPSEFWNACRHR